MLLVSSAAATTMSAAMQRHKRWISSTCYAKL